MTEGQESLHTADGPTDYIISAAAISTENRLGTFTSPSCF